MHERNCFLTLTYADQFLPAHGQLLKRDLQLFFMRLRKLTGPFRYVACGEYGELRRRPHFHVCLFGKDFREDRIEYSQAISGETTYVSPTIGRTWAKSTYPMGHQIGSLTFESAAYVARYICKRVSGPGATPMPLAVLEDGELVMPNPEFLLMSKGIGKSWFREYFMQDVFPHGRVITKQGTPAPVPRYYKELLKELGQDLALDMQFRTARNAEQGLARRIEEDAPQRKAARTVYAKARMGIFQRDVKGV